MEQGFLDLITQIGPAILAFSVPIAVAAIKKVIKAVPKWSLPILAPVVALVGNTAVDWIAGISAGGPVTVAILGMVGLWIREVFDQVKKTFAGAQPARRR